MRDFGVAIATIVRGIVAEDFCERLQMPRIMEIIEAGLAVGCLEALLRP